MSTVNRPVLSGGEETFEAQMAEVYQVFSFVERRLTLGDAPSEYSGVIGVALSETLGYSLALVLMELKKQYPNTMLQTNLDLDSPLWVGVTEVGVTILADLLARNKPN